MKRLLSTILATAMALSLVACGSTETAPATTSTPAADGGTSSDAATSSEGTIVIGGLQDLSAGAATAGVAMHRGAEVAAAEINAAGGINGMMIDYKIYDVASDPQEALSAYNRLVDQDGACAIIGPPISNIGLALVDTAATAEVPVLGAFIDVRATEKDDGSVQDYMFLNQVTNQQAGAIQASYLMNELGATKIALFYDQSNSFGVSQVEAFRDYVLDNGGEIVSEQLFNSGDKDFKTQLTKISEAGAEGIFAPNYPQDNVLYVNTMAQLEMSHLYTMGGFDFAPPFLTSLPDPTLCDNVYFALNIAFDDPSIADLNQSVIDSYSDINTVDDISVKLYLGYDAMYMLKAALEHVDGDYTGSAIKNALETMGPVEMKTGTFGYTTESHQPIGLGMTIYKIEEGANIKVGPYTVE